MTNAEIRDNNSDEQSAERYVAHEVVDCCFRKHTITVPSCGPIQFHDHTRKKFQEMKRFASQPDSDGIRFGCLEFQEIYRARYKPKSPNEEWVAAMFSNDQEHGHDLVNCQTKPCNPQETKAGNRDPLSQDLHERPSFICKAIQKVTSQWFCAKKLEWTITQSEGGDNSLYLCVNGNSDGSKKYAKFLCGTMHPTWVDEIYSKGFAMHDGFLVLARKEIGKSVTLLRCGPNQHVGANIEFERFCSRFEKNANGSLRFRNEDLICRAPIL